jgi:protein tyrosine phosphatase (PTP) superfamily phosphohydrolase (DUF442 family)
MHADVATEPNAPLKPARKLLRRLLILLAVATLLFWPAWQIGNHFLGGNVHEVIPGVLFRGAQPSAASLESLIHHQKIRTVLNVRGCCWPDEWYVAEAKTCQRLGVNLEDICFSAVHLPSRHEVRRLVETVERAERPIFVHCRHGSDRTGIASMAAQLLLEELTFDAAHYQLSMRFGHMPIGKTTVLDRFMKLYADWLERTSQQHNVKNFRHWMLEEYRGGWCDAKFVNVERINGNPKQGMQYKATVKNTGSEPWRFRPTRTAGHHVAFKVVNDMHIVVHEGRGGMLDKTVNPGETIEVVLIVPPTTDKGYYSLMIDVIEEGHCWFHQTGSELWLEEFEIRE